MSRFSKSLAAGVLSVFVTGATGLVMGQSVSSPSGHLITTSVVGDGNNATFQANGHAACPASVDVEPELADAATFDLFVDTLSDILVFSLELNVTTGTLYDVPKTGFTLPLPALLPAFPTLKPDTYFTTPGSTAVAGAIGVNPSGQRFTFFDVDDNGPQTDFKFGQVTLIPNDEGFAEATLSGTLQTRADPTPIFDEFQYTFQITPVPEPGSLTLLSAAGLFGLLTFRRRKKQLK